MNIHNFQRSDIPTSIFKQRFLIGVLISTPFILAACGGSGSGGDPLVPESNMVDERDAVDILTDTTSDSPTTENSNNPLDEVMGDCAPDDTQAALLSAVNSARSEARFCGPQSYSAAPALVWHCQLAEAAQRHSLDMATEGFMSHTGSDGSSMRNRITDTGYNYRGMGENVAAGYGSATDVMAGWISSPGHCANIMNPGFTEFGSSMEFNRDSAYQYYWTQNFGKSF